MSPRFTILEALGGDARHEAMLVDTDAGALVLKALRAPLDAKAFLEGTRRTAAVTHPSLRPIRGAGKLPDGRLYVLVDPLQAASFEKSEQLALSSVVQIGLELCKALEALHQAGLCAGDLLATDLFLTTPACLDASLSPLTPTATPASDVQQLAARLVERSLGRSALGLALEGVRDVAGLTERLESIHVKVPTTVSAEFRTEVVEVVEPDLCGNQLGSWQLEKILGEGAMGRVYLARHTRIGRLAAVKVLKGEHASNLELVQRFIQEAQAVNAIKNEHIVEVYDFGEAQHRDNRRLVYCVMELLEGEALSDTLDRGPVAVTRAANIGMQLGRALHAAHQVGVIHRDIKPENIFLRRRPGSDSGAGDYVKVLDFGVAKLLKPIGDLPQSGTLAGVVVGTPEYMAPEQALGTAVDLRSDLYAVGLVIYELLSGVQPFLADTFGKLVVAITQTPPPPLPAVTRLGEPIPQGLSAVVLKCLAKDPEARYQSGEALALALEPWATGRAAAEPAAASPPPPPEPEEPLVLRRSPWPRLVAAALAATALGLGYFFFPAPSTHPEAMVKHEAPGAEVARELPPPAPAAPRAPEAPPTITLEVTSTPPGAQVARVDTGELLGITPLTKVLPRARTTGLTLTLAGYEAETRDVNLSQNVTVGIDLRPQRAAVEKKKPPKKKAKANNDGTVDPFEE